MKAKKRPLNKEIGLFDVDNRELGKDGSSLILQDRMLPFAEKLNRLYDFGYMRQLPFVFTTCCSGKFLKKDPLNYVLFIPVAAKDDSWMKNMENYRYFYIEKNNMAIPESN